MFFLDKISMFMRIVPVSALRSSTFFLFVLIVPCWSLSLSRYVGCIRSQSITEFLFFFYLPWIEEAISDFQQEVSKLPFSLTRPNNIPCTLFIPRKNIQKQNQKEKNN